MAYLRTAVVQDCQGMAAKSAERWIGDMTPRTPATRAGHWRSAAKSLDFEMAAMSEMPREHREGDFRETVELTALEDAQEQVLWSIPSGAQPEAAVAAAAAAAANSPGEGTAALAFPTWKGRCS
ncbi:unnamed protein product [Spirodela intermedia]|uniref:Uncharacterized protein n=1 Tax=Spirodela intermedia TaxID=51605 RepID=A0A7I8IQ53_SPIIN|nr:unnamed protein product [Spirodela intermedia]CAA6660060.1 unnamed protein product [Spirodela intermedia]